MSSESGGLIWLVLYALAKSEGSKDPGIIAGVIQHEFADEYTDDWFVCDRIVKRVKELIESESK